MKHVMNCLLALTLAVSGAVATGCADEGSPPVIRDLAFQSTTVTVGQNSTVQGELTFEDPDGDVTHFQAELRSGGQARTIDPQPIDTKGARAGKITFQLTVNTSAAGPVDVDLWVIDDAGNDSNHLTGQLTAQ